MKPRYDAPAFRSWVFRAMMVCGVLVSGSVLVRAGEGAVARGDERLTKPGQEASSAQTESRRHPAYQVFRSQLALPSIAAVGQGGVIIGGQVTIDVRQRQRVPRGKRQALADLFGMPARVIEMVLGRVLSKPQADAEQLAQELRTAVIDYKYLQDRWTRYRPPTTEQEKVKADALAALQAGEIERVWEMYAKLPRPQPPAGVRVGTR